MLNPPVQIDPFYCFVLICCCFFFFSAGFNYFLKVEKLLQKQTCEIIQ